MKLNLENFVQKFFFFFLSYNKLENVGVLCVSELLPGISHVSIYLYIKMLVQLHARDIEKNGSSLQMRLPLCAYICSIRTIHIKLLSKFLFDHLHPIDKDHRALEILIHVYIML